MQTIKQLTTCYWSCRQIWRLLQQKWQTDSAVKLNF